MLVALLKVEAYLTSPFTQFCQFYYPPPHLLPVLFFFYPFTIISLFFAVYIPSPPTSSFNHFLSFYTPIPLFSQFFLNPTFCRILFGWLYSYIRCMRINLVSVLFTFVNFQTTWLWWSIARGIVKTNTWKKCDTGWWCWSEYSKWPGKTGLPGSLQCHGIPRKAPTSQRKHIHRKDCRRKFYTLYRLLDW